MDNTIFERVNQLRHWVQMQQLAAIQLVCLVAVFIVHRRNQRIKYVNLPSRELRLHRQRVREEVMDDLSNRAKCRDTIRMNKEAFLKLCNILISDGGLRPTQRMSVKEQVARFLHIIGGDERNRFISWVYRRSSSTTSRTFHRVLKAILAVEDRFLQQPSGRTTPKEIHKKKRFFPYFKDCVGAIDGTHVRVRVPSKDVPRATGAGAETAKEKNKRRSSTGSDYSIDDINDLLTQNTVNLESLNNDNDVQFVAATPSPHETSNSTTEAKGKKRKCEEEEDINKGKKKKYEEEDDINKKITTSLENVASAIREGHTILKESNVILEKSRQRVYTEEEIYTGLETIGFDETKICEAYLFLVNHPESARAMFGCPYGVYWRSVRKFCTLELLSTTNIDSFAGLRRKELGLLVESPEAGEVVDVSQKVAHLAVDMTCRMLFGKSICDRFDLCETIHEMARILGAFNVAD
ncbi:hypothetical protein POM88_037307 [Heracleum sosnowskyi]|uniref:DUF8040 domain-containing protein n=1 Tax=Heracleum sosnowskyi TaxID=360622 RepID=A0AAD8HSB7_9APIA|nr:hypothetical protein POM88_037307 [Heracleum sosnowskyi]